MGDTGIDTLQKLAAEAGTKIRLAPGVIGKGGMIWLGLILVWGVALAQLSPDALAFDALLVLAMGILTRAVMGETQKMRDYAEKNPSTALLEGAELLAFKRFEAEAKELPAGDKSVPTDPKGEALVTVRSDKPQS